MTAQATKARSAKHVVKELGNDKLELVRGQGYWYFVYDNTAANVYETHSVMTTRLGDLSLEQWVEEGRELLAKVAEMLADRAESEPKPTRMGGSQAAKATLATNVLAMVTLHWDDIAAEYPDMARFDLAEIEPILRGEPGATVRMIRRGRALTRSKQLSSAVNMVGAAVVDRDRAPQETVATYNAVWALKVESLCPYCQQPYRTSFMYRIPHCPKARCTNAHDSNHGF